MAIMAITFDNAFSQRSKRKNAIGNINKFNLVYFSRPVSKDSIKITAFLEIPYNSLQFIKINNGFYASYDASIVFQNKDGKQIFRSMWSDSVLTDDYMHTQSRFRNRKHYTNVTIGKEKICDVI